MTDNEVETRPTIASIIRVVIESTPDLETAAAVDAVIASIHPADYEAYLRELIAGRISSEVGYLRNRVTPQLRKGVSTKQSLIRDEYWPRFLQQKIALPAGYKTMAAATAADLRFLADMRKTQANDLLNRADQFNVLADLMDKAKATHLEEIDPKAGQRVLEKAA